MKGRTLTGILVVLGFGLGMVLLAPARSVSKFMEACGDFIANALGL
jgi:hypothetical protein